jgi:hypothetical protein
MICLRTPVELGVCSGDDTIQAQYNQRATPLMFGDVHTTQ